MNPASSDDPTMARLLAINRLCDEYEGRWREGLRPDPAEFLARSPEAARDDLFYELVALDVEYLRKAGGEPDLDEYLARYPYADRRALAAVFRSDPTRIRPPATLGDYELTQRIAAGGMGDVFLARHRRMDRTVIVKVLVTDPADREVLRLRFDREVQITALLSHPHVVTAFDAREDGGVRYLVTEYMPGGDLGRFAKERGPLPVPTAVAFVRDAALGLAHAHEMGVVHRDVKPGNLLLDSAGAVRVADWGLARIRSAPDADGSADALTELGVLLGTVDYMSPEQANRPDRATTAADVYSLGCVLFFLLAGRPPFARGTALDRVAAHRSAAPPGVRELRPDTPEPLAELVAQMLAKEPGDRPADMPAVVAALDRLAPGGTNPWAALAVAERPARPAAGVGRRSFLAAGAVLGVGGVGVWLVGRRRRGTTPAPKRVPEVTLRAMPVEDVADYQRAWAEKYGVEVEMTDARGIRLVFIPPGTFRMGSPQEVIDRFADPKSEPSPERRTWMRAERERTVTVERPFYLGRTEVTHGEFAAFVAESHLPTPAEKSRGGWGFDARRGEWRIGSQFDWQSQGDHQPQKDHPAGNLRWDDARLFCRWLTAAAPPGVRYRLPGESEWEFAARGGTVGLWGHGDGEGELGKYAVFGNPRRTPRPVASLRPNAFGLYDMLGNLPEWCDAVDPWVKEPACPPSLRPARGGGFYSPAAHVRVAASQWLSPVAPDPGFRVVREIPS